MTLIDVPFAAQTLAETQNPIRQNFISIDNGFAVDHVAFNVSGQGFHNKVTFPLQTITPTFSGLNGLWSQVYSGTASVGEIWVNSRNGNQYPMTASVLSQTPNAPDNTNGWTFLPSGILIKWGIVTFTTGTVFVSLSAIGPAFTAIFSASASAVSSVNSRIVVINSLSTVGITFLSNTTASTTLYWIVYGR